MNINRFGECKALGNKGEQEDKKKAGTWIKPRHRVIRALLAPPLGVYVRANYNVDIQPFPEQGKEPYLILHNHQTPLDQFFVALIFKRPVYYLATEDIFSLGAVSDLIRWLVNPIPIKKMTSDMSAIKNMMKAVKEGGTICIAPEGNRTYSGKTETMSATIIRLAKKMGLPIALMRIEGGYKVHPRWSDKARKGPMKAFVSEVIRPEEYKAMSDEELYDRITQGLTVNDASADGRYLSKRKAEYIERLLYVCPDCGFSEFKSKGDEFWCTSCKKRIRIEETTELKGEDGEIPFRFVNDWYEYQSEFIRSADWSTDPGEAIFRDRVNVYEVLVYKKKILRRKEVFLSLFKDRIEMDGETNGEKIIYPYEEITAEAVCGRNKLNVYHGKAVWQITGEKSFNAVKYVNFYYRYKNSKKGNGNGEFLGF